MISKRAYKVLTHINRLGDSAKFSEIVDTLTINNRVFDEAEYCEYSKLGYFNSDSFSTNIIKLTEFGLREIDNYKIEMISKIKLPLISNILAIFALITSVIAIFVQI